MSFLATELIEPSIEKTKQLLLPINWKTWLKLAIIALFIGGGGGGGVNVRIPNAEQGQMLAEFFAAYWEIILGVFIALTLLGLVWRFVGAVFMFCLYDNVLSKKVRVFGYIGKNLSKGASAFALQIVIGLVSLIVLALIALPFIVTFARNPAGFNLDTLPPVYIIATVVLGIMIMVGFSLLDWAIVTLVFPHMYFRGQRAAASLRSVARLFQREYKEILMLLLMEFLITIIVGIILMLVILLLLVVFALIGAVFFIPGYLWYASAEQLLIPLIIAGGVIATILIVGLALSILVASVPPMVFFTYYDLEFMKRLLKKA